MYVQDPDCPESLKNTFDFYHSLAFDRQDPYTVLEYNDIFDK